MQIHDESTNLQGLHLRLQEDRTDLAYLGTSTRQVEPTTFDRFVVGGRDAATALVLLLLALSLFLHGEEDLWILIKIVFCAHLIEDIVEVKSRQCIQGATCGLCILSQRPDLGRVWYF